MGAYFKPLRRNLGVITLMTACAFAAGWIRSASNVDFFYVYGRQSMYGLGVFAGRLALFRSDRLAGEATPFWRHCPLHRFYGFHDGAEKPYDHLDGYTAEWRWDWHDLHIGAGVSNEDPVGMRLEQCVTPCWSIAIPLTLLSAWLLLSKPRPATPKTMTEFTTEKIG